MQKLCLIFCEKSLWNFAFLQEPLEILHAKLLISCETGPLSRKAQLVTKTFLAFSSKTLGWVTQPEPEKIKGKIYQKYHHSQGSGPYSSTIKIPQIFLCVFPIVQPSYLDLFFSSYNTLNIFVSPPPPWVLHKTFFLNIYFPLSILFKIRYSLGHLMQTRFSI